MCFCLFANSGKTKYLLLWKLDQINTSNCLCDILFKKISTMNISDNAFGEYQVCSFLIMNHFLLLSKILVIITYAIFLVLPKVRNNWIFKISISSKNISKDYS